MKKSNNIRPWQLLLQLCLVFVMLFQYAHGQTLPANFSRVLVAGSISSPTAMAFTPDNRILVCQKGGQLRVVKAGVLLGTPAVSLSVNTSGERGLIGVAVDPNFSTNNFIYLHYTSSSGPHNRVSRFTLGSNDLATGEVAILDLPTLVGIFHNGGGLAFGADGKLFVAVGENQVGSNSQNLDNYLGKVLRINTDGTVPAGNPFTGNAARSRIWAYGLRNPFTLAVDPVSGKLLVNDVGNATWEEINDATVGGRNFGWPSKEGMCTSGCTGFTNPIYVYATNRGDPPPNGQGCAINGGTFFNGAISNYPAVYNGKYFFLDYCGAWIDYINPAVGSPTRTGFGSNLSVDNVGIKQGPDGNLYYLRIGNNSLYRIQFNSGTTAPTITSQPQDVVAPVGGTASFSVTATGSPAPTYQWRKGTSPIAGATATTFTKTNVQLADAGAYNVVVTNSAGTVTSNNANLVVTQLPTATISSPTNGALFRSGDVITFSGSGTDPDDGTLPASSFEWWVDFHHATHTHPGPNLTDGVSGGSFTIDLAGHNETNVWYRIYLAVQDSHGAKDTSFVEIFPVTSNLTLATQPAGLQVELDNVPFTAPITTSAVSGASRTIKAVSPQTVGSTTYIFDHWSQGGSAEQSIVITDANATYTAHYTVAPTPVNLTPTHDAYVRDGTNAAITHGTTDPTLLITKVSPAGQLNNARESYLLFDAATITGNIANVTLKVYGKVDGTAVPSVLVGAFSVANTTWTESAITWNNKPATSASELADAAVGNTAFSYINWDVTNYVKSELLAGRTKISFALKSLQAHDPRIFYNAKEFGSNPPQLSFIVSGGNVPPTVSITSPANGANFTEPASFAVTASAGDVDGTVTGVEFFRGTTSLGVVNTPPYTVNVSGLAAGSYALTARATDNDGGITTSAPVNITVGPTTPCDPVTASADDGNVAANVLDNNLATRWSANGDGQWIQFCLSSPASVTGVQIAFYQGNTRTSTFDIQVGNDGVNWTTVSAGRVSSGTSLALETFNITAVTAKYVRILGHGNSVNLWNSYTEVKINTGTGGGGTFTLTPEADAYVRDGTNGDITHGTTDPTLLITKLSPAAQLNNARESYLRFSLATVTGTVTSATLRVYGKVDLTTVPTVPIGIFPVANLTWSESTITWNNKPASGATALATSNVNNTAFSYVTWDVTSYVQAELAASRNKVSFAMKSGVAHDPRVFWNSKEFGSNLPQLVVETSSSLASQPGREESLALDKAAEAKLNFSTYPNPFRGSNTITFYLEKAGHTNLTVFDISGKQVAVLVNGRLSAGNHRATFTPANKAAGVYILKMTTNGKVITKKLLKE